jgi:hypothetical protein
MNLAALERWHWFLISVVVGVGLGRTMRLTPQDFPSFGTLLNSHERFEAALTDTINDQPLFTDITVSRCRVAGLGDRDIVRGLYCLRIVEEGAYHWRPYYFDAPVPYRPVTGEAVAAVAQVRGPSSSAASLSIRDVMSALKVRYTHAWWQSYAMTTWLSASVLVIGVIWPTLLTRIAFGRWTRPPQEKGINLWRAKVSATPTRQAARSSFGGGAGDEDERSPEAAGPQPAATAGEPATVVALPLPNQPLVPLAASGDAAEHKEFGADADDYYPTEQKGHRAASVARADGAVVRENLSCGPESRLPPRGG